MPELDPLIDAAELREMLDRQQIARCLLRYTRGVDRRDPDLVRAAFHPDGIDCHGGVTGTVEDFLAWWLPLQDSREATQHFVTNQTIDIDGDVAHVETYYIAIIKEKGDPETQMIAGRYVDRLSRRDGEWRIAMRVVLPEWGAALDSSKMERIFVNKHRGSRDAADPTYERPLRERPSLG